MARETDESETQNGEIVPVPSRCFLRGADASTASAQGEVNVIGIRAHILEIIVFLHLVGFIIGFYLSYQYVYARIEREEARLQKNLNEISLATAKKSCDADQNSTDSSYDVDLVQKQAARWQVYLSIASGIPTIFTTIVLGTYSDKIGRRLLLVLPACGSVLWSICYGCVIYWNLPLSFLLIAHALEGTCGQLPVVFLAAFAYTSDVTSNGKKRSFQMAVLESLSGLAIGAATLGVGYMIKTVGFVWPNVAIEAVGLVNLTLVLFCLPASKPKSTYPDLTVRQYLTRVFQFYLSQQANTARNCYLVCWLIFFLSSVILLGSPGIETLYQLNSPLCWDSVKIGQFGAIRSITHSIGSVIIVKLLQCYLSDAGIAIVACCSRLTAFVLQGFAGTDAMMYSVAVVGMAGSVMMSMVRAIMSKLTNKSQYGALFAGISCTQALTTMAGPVIFNSIYEKTLPYMPGAVFFIMAGLTGITAILYVIVLRQLSTINAIGVDAGTHDTRPLLSEEDHGIENYETDTNK